MIYLDHASTTPCAPEVVRAMTTVWSENFGNPSSSHSFGRSALSAVDNARQQIGRFLNCAPDEIIFTSGATESNNLALRGIVKNAFLNGLARPHIITSQTEHKSILETARELERDGVEVNYLAPDKNGIISATKVKNAITENTVLVSIAYANNETGAILPVRSIAKEIKKINESREKDWRNTRPRERGERPRPILFHTDAAQAAGFLNCDTKWNYFDLMTFSGHKIYGPKGIGALFVRSDVPIMPIQFGGSQEMGRRAGTLNVPGIVGFGAAVELLNSRKVKNKSEKIKKLRDYLVDEVLKNIPIASLNTDLQNSLPNIVNFSFNGKDNEILEIALDMAGIAVSGKSACMSGDESASFVLRAMGRDEEIAKSALRFSLGRATNRRELIQALKVLKNTVNSAKIK